MRTRSDGDVYFSVRQLPAITASSHTAESTTWTRARGSRAPSCKRDPLDFALWKAPEAGRGHRLGRRPGGAAGRAGTSSARRWPRRCSASTSRSTAAASDLIFPHHENEAAQTARGARRAAGAAVDAQRDGPARQRRRWPSRSATSSCSHEALGAYGRDALIMYFCARPLPPADRVRRRAPRAEAAARGARGSGRPARRLERRPDARRGRRRCASGSSTRWRDDFNTPRALAAGVRVGPRGEPGRPGGVGDATICARCSTCSGWRTCSRPRRVGGAGGGARRSRERASGPAPQRDFAEADRLRDELARAGLGGPRRARTGPSCCRCA